MALTITEEWIRERVQLKHSNLDDVRALSLPGTYHEKIVSLGDSLIHFTRLKSLDLSRNALESLAGLENLKILEKLNVYYNNIASIEELHRLRFNTKLQELDFRLNPVARNEPDYRLILVHMLPNLRRLDDRVVRDLERKAALMHFSSEQASQLTQHAPQHSSPERRPNPRAEHVRSLAKPPFVADHDDEALLSLVSRTRGKPPNRKVFTGSTAKDANVEDYPSDVIRQMNLAYWGTDEKHANREPASKATSTSQSTHGLLAGSLPSGLDSDNLQYKYPNLYPVVAEALQRAETGNDSRDLKRKKTFGSDSNLKFQDEVEAYTSYKAVGHFTPNPAMVEASDGASFRRTSAAAPAPPDVSVQKSRSVEPLTVVDLDGHRGAMLYEENEEESDADMESTVPLPSTEFNESDGHAAYQQDELADDDNDDLGEFRDYITRVSDLADKYWNGSKSLLKNQRFKKFLLELIVDIQQKLSSKPSVGPQDDLQSVQNELRRLQSENTKLQEKLMDEMDVTLGAGDAGVAIEETKLKANLIRSQRDLAILKGRLQQTVQDNKTLLDRVAVLESQAGAHSDRRMSPAAPASVDSRKENESLQAENDQLKQQLQTLTIRLKQSSQMQELAAMLQESHKSLVQTNEHLLRELNDTRRHHDDEMRQLSSTLGQLKRSNVSSGSISGGNLSGVRTRGVTLHSECN